MTLKRRRQDSVPVLSVADMPMDSQPPAMNPRDTTLHPAMDIYNPTDMDIRMDDAGPRPPLARTRPNVRRTSRAPPPTTYKPGIDTRDTKRAYTSRHHHRPAPAPAPAPAPLPLPLPRDGPSIAKRRARTSPAFREKVLQMATPLHPLVSLENGLVHPAFPERVVNYWLLTEAELDDMARFYHQAEPCWLTELYPCQVAWPRGMGIEEKRRRIGKFMGLSWCATPVAVRSEEELLEEARAARAADEEEIWRRKRSWY